MHFNTVDNIYYIISCLIQCKLMLEFGEEVKTNASDKG